MRDYKNEYQEKIAKYLGVDNISLFWKARVGLYAILKAMGVGQGDEVILPAYTCVVVPNAILYLGAKPIYADIDKNTFNCTSENIEAAITSRTKVIICQNTYGLSSELDQIQLLAKKNNLFTIEDCTHGFGGTFDGLANGRTCDAAIYSSQWNKPFSTGIGGFATIKSVHLREDIASTTKSLLVPSTMEVMQLKVLVYARRYLMNDKTYWPLLKLYRWLSAKNLVVGSSSGGEINSVHIPTGYFKAHSHFQAKIGMLAIAALDEDLQARKQSALHYSEVLSGLNKNHVAQELMNNHSFLKYPLMVLERKEFMRRAEDSRIALGDWFTSPLHPVSKNLHQWNFNQANFPNAVFCAQHVINLPTTNSNMKRVTEFLIQNKDLIMDAEGYDHLS